MKTLIAITVLGLALAGSAFADTAATADIVAQAATAVTKIQASMLDPDSFRVDSIKTADGNLIKCSGFGCRHKEKIPVTVLCFSFRSHNRMGGYSEGRAYLKGDNLQIFQSLGEYGEVLGYDEGWDAPCRANHITGDITAEVKAALAPPSQPAQSPEDKAKQAQDYADCMKVAVNNPAIVCKAPQN